MKTDEGTTEQVPDRSASAGTGYWLRRVVVNGGGRQMPRRAGDDLCGAVRVEGGRVVYGGRVGVGGVGVGALRTTALVAAPVVGFWH